MQVRPYQCLVVAVDAGVATISMNRPERRNALNMRLTTELLYAFEDAADDSDVRCVVLTGMGRAFCAGADLAPPAASESGVPDLAPKGGYDVLMRFMAKMPKPVVARVNGHAFGGGLGLVAASTLAIAANDAEFAAPEVSIGLFPFMIYAMLERVMPRRALVELLLSGQRLHAQEAASLGIVNRAVPPEELDTAVKAATDRLKAGSPSALRLGLAAMNEVESLSLDAKLPLLAQRLAECLTTEDAREGIAAFAQKRKPQWQAG